MQPRPTIHELLGALAPEDHRQILLELASGPATAAQLAKRLGESIHEARVQLARLRSCGLLTRRSWPRGATHKLAACVEVLDDPGRLAVAILTAGAHRVTLVLTRRRDNG